MEGVTPDPPPPPPAVVAAQDQDAEKLLLHFCLKNEAEGIASWCKEHAPRPSGAEDRLSEARRLRDRGNLAMKQGRTEPAMWVYLAAIHMLDFSEAAKGTSGLADDATVKRRWFGEILAVLSNLALGFLQRSDSYNAIRCADLGLWYSEKLQTPTDAQESSRAKLLYRRGLARFQSPDESSELASQDVEAACKLMPQDKVMPRLLSKIKASSLAAHQSDAVPNSARTDVAHPEEAGSNAHNKASPPPERGALPAWNLAWTIVMSVQWSSMAWRVGLVVLLQAACVHFQVPGYQRITWLSALLPVSLVVGRQLFKDLDPRGRRRAAATLVEGTERMQRRETLGASTAHSRGGGSGRMTNSRAAASGEKSE
uniref:Uncharacterized protein n=1 Tax=Rhizochromulina marina TaxID=1034831 RepID=A0A7S2SE70_9STRA|mmetsp:Transcript_28923/g.84420  ORF Transcript_28923/g.84420 Transcript_28923/m.84420 type:complete len:369 (+) Transcript_28923:188-1294(+)